MRWLIAILMMSSIVLAQCEGYVKNAEVYAAGSSYPNFFGAGQEYLAAATCYAKEGDLSKSRIYYGLAARYFIDATGFLQSGGDYILKGRLYESAADAYAALGDQEMANMYYEKAIDEYKTGGADDRISLLKSKLSGAIVGSSEIPWLLIITVAAIIVFVVFLIRSRIKKVGESPSFEREEKPKLEIKPKQPTMSAKEKMREKIRKKYGLE